MRWYRASRWLAPIIDQIPEVEREEFMRIGYTIGGMMVFPANRVDGKMTINGARGCHPRIKDRFDLTVECIRRHYLERAQPAGRHARPVRRLLRPVRRLRGLRGLLPPAGPGQRGRFAVRFFMPFEDFTASPLPATVDAYLGYRQQRDRVH